MAQSDERLRHAPLIRVLHALASGETTSVARVEACLAAIARDADGGAWAHVDAEGARAAAAASDARRRTGGPLGRLDGVPLAVADLIDVAGQPTGLGVLDDAPPAAEDAAVVARLRAAGAVLLGKTAVDPLGFGTTGANPLRGDVRHPRWPERRPGGAAAGAAVAVASGHAVAALATDTLGAVRIPAAFCGVFGLKPTLGELSMRGCAPGVRRLDCPGLLARGAHDLAPLLQVMAGYDAADPRSRRRRVPLAPPDWAPGALRAGVVGDLAGLGADATVATAFAAAMATVTPLFGSAAPVRLALAPLEIARTRRAAVLLMEAELSAVHGDLLPRLPPALQTMLDFAARKSACDAAAADRQLDAHVVRMRALFEQFDVLLLPTVPLPAVPVAQPDPPGLADFTALASLAGCPALSLPLPEGLGLQLVGAPGSDLRLLELGEVLAAVLDADG